MRVQHYTQCLTTPHHYSFEFTPDDAWSLISLDELQEMRKRKIGFPQRNHVLTLG